MKKILFDIKMLAALLLMAVAMTACTSNNDVIEEPVIQPEKPKAYTITVTASKSASNQTRALALSGSTLNATWDENENVEVYQSGSKIGDLKAAASATASTTLTGTLTSAPSSSADLTFYFHSKADTPTYTGQDGTLATIGTSFDYCAPATVTSGNFTVDGVNMKVAVPGGVNFGANQQAIVKFTLLNGTIPINAESLEVRVRGTEYDVSYTVNPTPANNELYVAIPGFSSKDITLIATTASGKYAYRKATITFNNGQYYEINVKMAQAHLLSTATIDDVGKVVDENGLFYDSQDLATAAHANTVAMIAYIGNQSNCTHGLAIALADESNPQVFNNGELMTAHTPSITNCSWRIPSKTDWEKMFNRVGDGDCDVTSFRTMLNALSANESFNDGVSYWSSTLIDSEYSWRVYFTHYGGTYWASFQSGPKTTSYNVRAVLAF